MSVLVGVLLFPGVEELDAVGPWEVLGTWARLYPGSGAEVTTISRDGAPVLRQRHEHRCQPLVRRHAVARRLAPSWRPGHTRALLLDVAHLDWLRSQRARVPLLAGVCTGSLPYAAAALLRNRPATTHWRSLELLASLDPTIEIRPRDRFVDDGDMITSAGVSAGIDMALHLVARLGGDDHAGAVRREIEYDPQPPR